MPEQIGFIGLAVMGENLVLNLTDKCGGKSLSNRLRTF